MSLRSRLLASMIVVGFLLAMSGLAVTRITRTYLVDQVDTQLIEVARHAPRFLGQADRRPPLRGIESLSSLYVAVEDGEGGWVVRATPDLVATDASPPDFDSGFADTRRARPVTVSSVDGSIAYRAITLGNGEVRAVLAVPLGGIDVVVRRLFGVQAFLTAGVILVLGLVGYWVMRYGVRPIIRMTEAAQQIAAEPTASGQLSHRVPAIDPSSEAGALGSALNRMLTRIESAMDEREESERRLRRFVADASHELRTPVATVRGYAELYRMGGLEEQAALAEAMRRTESESIRMGTLVDDLLLLSRLDQGRPLERRHLDLSTLSADVVSDLEVIHTGRTIIFEGDAVSISGDEHRLRQVLSNVIGNAAVHTPNRSAIRVTSTQEVDHVLIRVTDEGPGMTEEELTKATDRFYRADASRARSSGGSGLGLSIAQAIVQAHGGRLTIESTPRSGTTVSVSLPTDGQPISAPSSNVTVNDT